MGLDDLPAHGPAAVGVGDLVAQQLRPIQPRLVVRHAAVVVQGRFGEHHEVGFGGDPFAVVAGRLLDGPLVVGIVRDDGPQVVALHQRVGLPGTGGIQDLGVVGEGPELQRALQRAHAGQLRRRLLHPAFEYPSGVGLAVLVTPLAAGVVGAAGHWP